MGLRFRRRITIAPGIHLNISKSGIGASIGPRGAKVGVGPRGVHGSLGLPGTGIHYREEISWAGLERRLQGDRAGGSAAASGGRSRGSRTSAPPGPAFVDLILRLPESGKLEILDSAGTPLSAHRLRALRPLIEGEIEAFLSDRIRARNGDIERILGIHLDTPDPGAPPVFQPLPFPEPRPMEPAEESPGLIARIWPPARERALDERAARLEAWEAEVTRWNAARDAYEVLESVRRARFDAAMSVPGGGVDADLAEAFLEERFAALDWPRETRVALQLVDDGAGLALDVELPEVEELPTETATRAGRGFGIRVQAKSEAHIRREYMQHVHGVLFRLIGEAFHALPGLDRVTATGSSVRADPGTGHLRDDVLLSVRVARSGWTAIHFRNLAGLDVVAAFEAFELKRSMTRTGIFRPVEPFEVG